MDERFILVDKHLSEGGGGHMEPDDQGDWVRYSDLAAARAEIERLTAERNETAMLLSLHMKRAEKAEAERDEARAQVAAAHEAAAKTCSLAATSYLGKGADTDLGSRSRAICDVACRIRALTPADAQAAIEAYGREKVREGMRRAADVLAQEFNIRDIQIKGVTVQGCEIAPPSWCRNAILDEMEKLK